MVYSFAKIDETRDRASTASFYFFMRRF